MAFMYREIIVDNFAGGGGASTGIEMAIGRSVDIAINHDPAAIVMHKANHPTTEHYCESVWVVDPKKACRGRRVALAWFSPDCKHHSKAKGGKPVDKNIRGLAWVAEKWAGQVGPRVIILENVEEFEDWGPLIAKRDKETGRVLKKDGYIENDKFIHYIAAPGERVPVQEQLLIPDPKRKGEKFRAFVRALEQLGYVVEWKVLIACDYGAPTGRKRLFVEARRDGQPIIWPKPTHGDPNSPDVKSGKLKPWRTAAEIIDWNLPCPSIFDRKRPLADNTLKRIALGIKKFVMNNPKPFIVQVNYSGAKHHYCNPIEKPLSTITSKHGFGLVTPVISQLGQTGGGDRLRDIKNPLSTIVSKAEHMLVTPFLAQYHTETGKNPARGLDLNGPMLTVDTSNRYALVSAFISRHFGQSIGHTMEDPLGTVTAGGGGKSQLVTSHLVKFRGKNYGSPMTEPVHTITAGGNHIGEVRAFLMTYYGNSGDVGQQCDEPLRTVVSKDRFGLVTIEGHDYQIVDIGMRMLEPHELFAAQGFPRGYVIDRDYRGKAYPKTAQVARCGNAVPPPFAEALTRANLPELCIGNADLPEYKERMG
jgi:DNA (cytosine-5)-methyltransferase 1